MNPEHDFRPGGIHVRKVAARAPCRVIGDVHGQFADLICFLEAGGYPPDQAYVFLGGYVDRGPYSVECAPTKACASSYDATQRVGCVSSIKDSCLIDFCFLLLID